ncbi:hypothetical protein KUTeg_004334 [Tegillarca granosa]|uniref:HAT C-terminal dimerisation domain-containing protein n=1 Tax=Tegillarca granosa TaxID=220873 RepID=A0ABQ9FU58_TEGGR|nr:hypothetical protein KUTeg_004334 [Tegillarca granosa]
MCVPATSVPSKRVFSTAGGTVTKQRIALEPDTLGKLIFINKLGPSTEVGKNSNVQTPKLEIKQKPMEKEPVGTIANLPSVKDMRMDEAVPVLPALQESTRLL